jgi:hypothetical protein
MKATRRKPQTCLARFDLLSTDLYPIGDVNPVTGTFFNGLLANTACLRTDIPGMQFLTIYTKDSRLFGGNVVLRSEWRPLII